MANIDQSITLGIGAVIGSSFAKSMQAVNTSIGSIGASLDTLSNKKLQFKTLESLEKDLAKTESSLSKSMATLEQLKEQERAASLTGNQEAIDKATKAQQDHFERVKRLQAEANASAIKLAKTKESGDLAAIARVEKAHANKEATLQKAMEQTAKKQEAIDRAIAERVPAQLKQKIAQQETAVNKIKAKQLEQVAAVEKEKTALGKVLNEREKINSQLDKAIAKQTKIANLTEEQSKNDAAKSELRGQAIGVVAIGASLALPIKQAVDFESAMADVKKVVDFESPAELKVMEADILRLTRTLPMTAQGISSIMASAGQAGIAKNELLGFAESAAKMGVAFDVTADEAGDMMAKWRTAFKMNQTQVNTLADQINFLGNTTAASAPKISDVVRRIGPLGEVGGLAAGQIAAIGASMVSTGVESEVAATAIKNFMLSTVAGASATKGQKEAYKSLGLDAEKLAKRMQVDAGGAIDDLLTRLQKLPKHMQAATMKELFGSESIGAIAPLLTNLDALRGNLAKVGDASQYAGSMNKEFEARAATTANSFQLMTNKLSEIGITIGSVLLPAVNTALNAISPIITGIADFAKENENLVKGVLAVGGAMLALKVGMMASAYGLAVAKGAMIALNLAMTANPIGLVVKALAFLGVGLYAAWDYLRNTSDAFWEFESKVVWAFESVVDSGKALWDGLGSAFSSGVNFVASVGSTMIEGLKTVFGYTPIGLIVNNFDAIVSYLGTIPDKFKAIGTAIVDGLMSGLSSMGDAIKSYTITPVMNMVDGVKSKLGIKSPSRVFMGIGSDTVEGMQIGMTQKTPSLIDNAKQGVSNLAQAVAATAVISTASTALAAPQQAQQQASASAQPNVSNTYTITINQQPGQDPQALAQAVMAEINRQQAVKSRSGMYDR
ncbi:MAG TPA: phage tail tape measure protein [Thiotrichales bacterium]|nr:phage tail tape measure protein [Thiotrichales bacterium]